jgi:uncharacterized RDD family membrane protein YckC
MIIESQNGVKQVNLIPPEGVPLSFEIASLWDRLGAVIIDISVIFLSIIALYIVVVLVLIGLFMGGSSSSVHSFFAIVLLMLFFLRQGYFLFFELIWQGTTPGKRFASIQVVSRDGGVLSAPALISRNLLREVELFIPLGLLIAPQQISSLPTWIWFPAIIWVGVMIAIPALNRENLRMGDLLGGTMVIRVPKAVLLEDKARHTGLKGTEISFLPQQLLVYGEYELETLASILRNVDEAKIDTDGLRKIAQTIAIKIKYTGDAPTRSPLQFLRLFYSAQRAALEKKLLFGQRKADKYDHQ